jgi:hypothetical protein
MHPGSRRSRGPDTWRKIGRDNVGKGLGPAGAGSNLQRPSVRGIAEAEWRDEVWRMSLYERRRRGNALPGGSSSLPRGGNTGARQRGSGRLAVPGWLSDTEPRHGRPMKRGRDDEQTSERWGVCGPVLKPRHGLGRLIKEKPRSEPDRGNPAVRDRRGACRNVDKMGAGMRPVGKPSESPPYPTRSRALHFYPDQHGSQDS